MNLVIVESPTKAKTISRFLGSDFVVKSSYGHMRDLPKSKLGVDVANDFEPTYVIPEKSKKVVEELKRAVKRTGRLILATDGDREGEAIAWHLVEALGLNARQIPKAERIVFHEITERAIKEALRNPRGIDMNLVDAQQARRILDRLVGYELSPFLWKKIKTGLSAGRVQSAALRIIVEREREIGKFKPQEYWTISAEFRSPTGGNFSANLVKANGEQLPKPGIPQKESAEEIVSALKSSAFSVSKIEVKETKRRPLAPFTTSTLQQAAWQRLRFSARQTMRFAQQLYEGMDLGEGPAGLITYMRTDSTNLSYESVRDAAEFIGKTFGDKYTLPNPRFFKTKSKLAQEAHEAIRPTDPWRTPDTVKKHLDSRQYKLYSLIWQRFIATQMSDAKLSQVSVTIEAKNKKSSYELRASGQRVIFDGFLKIWPTKLEETTLPPLKENDRLALISVDAVQHFTEPLPRYNDASLVKTLEEYGIGRPSTYAPTIATLEFRSYIERDEKRYFRPTHVGTLVTELLETHFHNIIDYGFTAKIEEELDEIAEGKRGWLPVVKEMYEPFHSNLLQKEKEVTRKEATERPSDQICEKCGKPMVVKYGKYGPFIACTGYPECKNTKKIPVPSLGIKCQKCDDGEVVMRKTKAKKRTFYGCSKWPACDFASWKKPANDEGAEALS